ncbi:MAG: formyltransferase family protein [Pseudomonadota bacterium]
MLNIAFLGSGGDFSLLPLKFLLASEFNLCLIGVDGISKTFNTDPRLQIFCPEAAESVESLAGAEHIPVLDFSQNINQLCTRLEEYQLDVLIVACYSHKLADRILTIPKIASVNLHPSLLPAYRGPVPLFWQFRQGKNEFGISLHKMVSSFDTGAILSQQTVSFSDGISHHQANLILGKLGAQLLVEYLQALKIFQVIEKPQQAELSSYMSYPKDRDFKLSNKWSAQRIYNFICATKHWGRLYPCLIDNRLFNLKEVISYKPQVKDGFFTDNCSYSINQDIIFIACKAGMLKARLSDPINNKTST